MEESDPSSLRERNTWIRYGRHDRASWRNPPFLSALPSYRTNLAEKRIRYF